MFFLDNDMGNPVTSAKIRNILGRIGVIGLKKIFCHFSDNPVKVFIIRQRSFLADEDLPFRKNGNKIHQPEMPGNKGIFGQTLDKTVELRIRHNHIISLNIRHKA